MSAGFAGRLRARVALSRRADTRDALGAAVGEWIENGTAWATMEPDGHGAFVAGGAREGSQQWRATLRPCDIRVGDLIEWLHYAMIVRTLVVDPALPDRIVALGEEQR